MNPPSSRDPGRPGGGGRDAAAAGIHASCLMNIVDGWYLSKKTGPDAQGFKASLAVADSASRSGMPLTAMRPCQAIFHAAPPQWPGEEMNNRGLRYWMPRVLVLSFALSLLLPAPEFVTRLDAGGRAIWLARLIWVISIPAVFGSILVLVATLGKK